MERMTANPLRSSQNWNAIAAEWIRKTCYPQDGKPEPGWDISRDLAWWKGQLKAGHDDAKIISALKGMVLLEPRLRGRKWAPARMFSKRGNWVDLFDRAFLAYEKTRPFRSIQEILGMIPPP